MNSKVALFLALCFALCMVESPHAFAIGIGEWGLALPCDSNGVLFNNSGTQPTNFDLGASWNVSACKVVLSWIDANGQSRAITLSAPVFESGPTSTDFPSRGVSSTLQAGAPITWTTSAGTGNGSIYVTFVRPPSTLALGGTQAPPKTATFGAVVGKSGVQLLSGRAKIPCGSRGVFYNNLTTAPITFDLMIQSQTPYEIGDHPTYSCGVTVYWRDTGGNLNRFDLTPWSGKGAIATSLPANGVISWHSWPYPTPYNGLASAFEWQFERAVEVPGP